MPRLYQGSAGQEALRPDWFVMPGVPAPVIVIGGVNMDISGTPERALIPRDSNPGTVTLHPGGVGRNIAENLRRLDHAVSLATVLGDDPYAGMLRDSCAEMGIDLRLSSAVPGGRTPVYLCVNEAAGELYAAVADMSLCARMTPAWVEDRLGALNAAALVIADANLPADSLAFLAKNLRVPLLADPVSVSKAEKLRPMLPCLTAVKPNISEAELLSGVPIRSDEDLPRAAAALLATGLKSVFISLGARGVWADNGREHFLMPVFPCPVRNTTGCGDAFLAGVAHALLAGGDLRDCARTGLAAAAICAGDGRAVSPALSRQALRTLIARQKNSN